MTVTGYKDSTAEVSLTIPSMDAKCDNGDLKHTDEEMTRVKVTGAQNGQNYSNNQEEKDPFVDDNNCDLSRGPTIEIISVNHGAKAKIDIDNNCAQRKDCEDDEEDRIPPDGGVRAWTIMLGSFFINGILFGVINSYSLIYDKLIKILGEAGGKDVASSASLVGTLTMGTTFFISPVAGILTDKIGIQVTTLIGGCLAFGGLFLSSLFSEKVVILCLTYGIIYGLGASLAYTPSLVILGHYFKRHLGIVNGVVTAGSSVFTTIMPVVMKALLDNYGLDITLRFLAVLTSAVMVCALLFKPIHVNKSITKKKNFKSTSCFRSKINMVIDASIWKRKRYVAWATAMPIALLGYFVTYVHIVTFVKKAFEGHNEIIPNMCLGISSGVGRLVFGFVADRPGVNRILLQQISFVSIGLMTILLPFTPPHWGIFLTVIVFMGLFDGCFISLLGPIAFDICGKNGAAQAIGMILGMCSIPLTIGSYCAGKLYDVSASYTIPFIFAGIPPLIGALAMCRVYYVNDDPKDLNSENSLNNKSPNNGIGRTGLDSFNCSVTKRQEDDTELTRL